MLREWKKLAEAKVVTDPTDRDYGIFREVDMDEEVEDEVVNIDVHLQDDGKGMKGKKTAQDKRKERLINKAKQDADNVDEEGDEDDVISIWSTDDEHDINLDNDKFDKFMD